MLLLASAVLTDRVPLKQNKKGNMHMIKKILTVILSIALAVSLVSCGKERSPLEKLAGYYEADLRKLLGEDVDDDYVLDMSVAALESQGYMISLKIDKEGNGTITEKDGDNEKSVTVTFDPDTNTAELNGQKMNYASSGRTIELDGISYVKTSKPSEQAWPYGAGVSLGGDVGIGYFWVPDDWYDTTDWTSDELVVTYEDYDGTYDITAFSYTKEEWEVMDEAVFESPESLLDALTSTARGKYASSITTDDTFETDLNGMYAVRNDMFYKDGSGTTTVVSQNGEETYIVLVLGTYTEEATSHMEDFVAYVTGHYVEKHPAEA